MIVLGPAVVRSSATLSLRVLRGDEDVGRSPRVEVTVPSDPAKRAEAVVWLATMTMFGGSLGDIAVHTRPAAALGAITGYAWAVRTWNRWQR
jgi:hypothetical protein